MNTFRWIRFKLVGVLSVSPLILASSALILGLTFICIQGCGGPQKSVPESPSATVQSPSPTGQVPGRYADSQADPGSRQHGGFVLGGGAPIADSTVTLWAAGAGEPKR